MKEFEKLPCPKIANPGIRLPDQDLAGCVPERARGSHFHATIISQCFFHDFKPAVVSTRCGIFPSMDFHMSKWQCHKHVSELCLLPTRRPKERITRSLAFRSSSYPCNVNDLVFNRDLCSQPDDSNAMHMRRGSE